MDILEIYKRRKLDLIEDKYNKLEDKIKEEDEIQKILLDAENQINVLLNRNEENRINIWTDSSKYTIETQEKLKELYIEKNKEFESLDSLVDEVKAQLEIADSYKTTIEIYKNYGILNKEGKIYNGEKSKK